MFKKYLKTIGLLDLVTRADEVELNNFVAEAFATKFPKLSTEQVKKLYIYDVPWVSTDGLSCILDKKADKPYNLAETFGLVTAVRDSGRTSFARMTNWKELKNHPQTIRLWRLNKIVDKIYKLTKVEWFGVYHKIKNLNGDLVLVKEAYKGVFSRAEFPLTKEFAKKSNNSTVGLTGKAIVIQDVASHTGAYYKCDGEVNSEFCLPILDFGKEIASPSARNDEVEVIGIIDAEAFAKNHYTNERLLQIAKVAYDLGQTIFVDSQLNLV